MASLGWTRFSDQKPKPGVSVLLLRDEGVFLSALGPAVDMACEETWYILGYPAPPRGTDRWLYKDDLRSLPTLAPEDDDE